MTGLSPTRRLLAVALSTVAIACTATQSPGPSDSAARPSTKASPVATAGASTASASPAAGVLAFTTETFAVPAGSHPHDVAPAPDGGVWYTAQAKGVLGWLDPDTGQVREAALGPGSAPHGVIVGPDGAAWVTDGGLNGIVRVAPGTLEVTTYPLPSLPAGASLNTPVFDSDGDLWFTGQRGYYGRLDPASRAVDVHEAPRGAGPYGITATPGGDVYFASLAGSYLGAVDLATGEARVIEPPTSAAGVRRAWSDSHGRIWISEWNAGQVGVYDPATDSWREWRLPGDAPQAYSVFVDEIDGVWLTDFGANSVVRFDPSTETFESFPLGNQAAEVRQQNGRPGEVWGAESGTDKLIVIRFSAG